MCLNVFIYYLAELKVSDTVSQLLAICFSQKDWELLS